MRVLVIGATGAIGRQLVPQLLAAGHQVSATTRSPVKLDGLSAAGTDAVVLDGLDGAAVGEAVARAEPRDIVHARTAIPAKLNPRPLERPFAATHQLRTVGVAHLLTARSAQGGRGGLPPVLC